MSTLLTNIGTVITSIVGWLGSVATALIGNEVFPLFIENEYVVLGFTSKSSKVKQ